MQPAESEFEALCREIGFPPDGPLELLKACYRRRVAQWHPDRGLVADAQAERLKQLNRRYAAALEFHRRHGRLPGPGALVEAVPPPPSLRSDSLRRDWQPTAPPATTARGTAARWFASVLIIATSAWMLWPERGATDASVPVAMSAITPAHTQAAAFDTEPYRLEQGMSRQQVVALLGEPSVRRPGDALWSYGPSWVRFECGRLAGWYSSPAAGLRARGIHPGERIGLGPDEGRLACGPELPAALAGQGAE